MRDKRQMFENSTTSPLQAGRRPYAILRIILAWCGALLALDGSAQPIRDALGMIESGNDDYAVGSAGEISRYQIKKDIWRAHSSSSRFSDKNEAWRITQIVLDARIETYRRHTGHGPTAFDIYVLWNAPGHFQRVGYQPRRVSRVVAERATRFANLVERFETAAAVRENSAGSGLVGLKTQGALNAQRRDTLREGKILPSSS